MADTIPLFENAIQANKIGGFIKGGKQFDVIRPGYDSQGRRRKQWTQVIHGDVPVFAVKMECPLPDVIKRFDKLWDIWIGNDAAFLDRLLTANRLTHLKCFRDGITGETPAPTHTRDGKMQPKISRPT